jgi:hypothetical protein
MKKMMIFSPNPIPLENRFTGYIFHNTMNLQVTSYSIIQTRLSPYTKFKMVLKSQVHRQYPNLL